jgi:hypothetical protein
MYPLRKGEKVMSKQNWKKKFRQQPKPSNALIKAELVGNVIHLEIPLDEGLLNPSRSRGHSTVATTHGVSPTTLELLGKTVCVNATAFIEGTIS